MQTAADAGALAIAQDCAGPTGCGNPSSHNDEFRHRQRLRCGNGRRSRNLEQFCQGHSESEVDYAFAPVIGIDRQQVVARVPLVGVLPIGGRAVLPIIFSWCSFKKQTDGGVPSPTTTSIRFTKEDDSGCTGPSGNAVPGGFGWVLTDSGKACAVTSTSIPAGATNILCSDTGANRPCSDSYFTALLLGPQGQGKTVLLPLFDKAGGTGSNALVPGVRLCGLSTSPHSTSKGVTTGSRDISSCSWNRPTLGLRRRGSRSRRPSSFSLTGREACHENSL